MVLTMEDMGFVIEASHHEMSPAQHEIDFQYDEALSAADNIMTFKLVVKTIAKRHGLHAILYAKTEVRREWFRHAYEHVIKPGWCEMYFQTVQMRKG